MNSLRTFLTKSKSFLFFLFIFLFGFYPHSLEANTLCEDLENAWSKVNTYQCTFRAVAYHPKKVKVTIMKYSYARPNLVRMDIEKPKKGAVLIYNPNVHKKVKIRPFPHLPFMVLKYALTHKRVMSSRGGTIDKSDLGHRAKTICKNLDDLDEKV